MSKISLFLAVLISFGFIQNGVGDSASLAALKKQQSVGEELIKEMGSPAMFKQGPFTPKTGDAEADNILREFHKMYAALDARDWAEAKLHEERAKTLAEKWTDKRYAQLNDAKKGI